MKTRSTTIIAVRKNGVIAIAGDGQVTLGSQVMKSGAKKVRLLSGGKVMAGFAGSAADGIALFERLESKMESVGGNLTRAAVELAKDWRMDKFLRHLEAVLIVSDGKNMYLISGNGDIIEPDDDILTIGSGGGYALAAAKMLIKHTKMTALEIAKEALQTASEICIYTNNSITALELGQ
ncbi:ATP-dependent protease subunit HslV [Myxococcota bacterium]|nr:ATP-dependent protease subunit HslV [Myxococcota bacterium]MBU1381615.1 ATP-dependent protease subunit HslV [Myxococcota bacterium]MBU1496841.1 ATP-dependent protease subunit HslV [Myxococcota bacterium]